MIKFRQKEYSIKEGHYTGPKDGVKVPSTLTMLAKGAGAGAIAGTVVGAVMNKIDKDRDQSVIGTAIDFSKAGALAGLGMKILLNTIHNPMKSVKYQDVDKKIRTTFGVYTVSGITVGDSIDKRASIDEKFGFNDRNVTNYKLTFAIADNRVSMYTFGMSDKELEVTDKSLDYYCKKYYGMEYSSTPISAKNNSYAVYITFTNCQIIANFILELSNALETKINLLDNNALIQTRLMPAAQDQEEGDSRNFSVAGINKYDALEILGKSGAKLFVQSPGPVRGRLGQSLSGVVIGLISGISEKLTEKDLVNSKVPVPRYKLGNKYLEEILKKKLRYVEGFHYIVGDKNAKSNMSLVQGHFMVTVAKDSSDNKKVDDLFWKKVKAKVRRNIVNSTVVVYNYSIESEKEFENYLKMLMSTRVMFNIFE